MARSGLYKSEVKKARDALIAQGKHPSVDAVRIALGNTGSKTTIHKYLKELEEEDGGASGRKASVSEALQDLVARLAAQLQDEANTQIDALRAQHAEQERLHAEALDAMEKELDTAHSQLQRTETILQEERAAHDRTREAVQRETVVRHTAEQQVADLKERLVENESHRQSLEEKHQHAREALEHYRQSVKEQRDQDLRRHEQQVQQLQAELRQVQQTIIIKQEETIRLNQEGVRLVGDLSHAQKTLRERHSQLRQLEQRLEDLRAFEAQSKSLEAQLAGKEKIADDLKIQFVDAGKQIAALTQQVHRLQVDLAAGQAKLEAQQTIALELRAYMEQSRQMQATGGAPAR